MRSVRILPGLLLLAGMAALQGCGGGTGAGTGGPTSSAPASPAHLSARAGDTLAVLTWDASSGATGYRVKRSTQAGGPYTQLSAPAGTSHTDTALANGTTYHYVVSAVNDAGESPDSAETTATPTASGATSEVWVQGYYVGYHNGIQPPSAVDYTAMTHIMIGAALPVAGGTWNTDFYLGGAAGPAWAKETITRAHAAGTKAILMLGGDGTIDAFRTASDPTVRATFVRNLKTIVDEYHFDGIDVDWEPLELSGANDDRARFLAFTQELRTALPDKIMTMPTGWNNANFNDSRNPYYGTLSAYYDRINMMSYGMIWCGSGWESWHFAALYGETSSTPSSIDNTVKALIAAGVPKAKIGIGIGFYGVPIENGSWQNNTWVPRTSPPYVTAPHQSTDQARWRISDNDVSYSNILRYYDEASARRWDDTAKAPYLSFATPKQIAVPAWPNPPIRTTYVTYEDERSIAEKGAYVRAQGLGGTILWTISEGYLDWTSSGEKDPLMKAVKAAFLP